MPKKRTKADKYRDFADAVSCIKQGKKPRRSTRKDGSIPTHPVVDVRDVPESIVLEECLKWLREHGCLADRLNNGKFQTNVGWRVFGIIGGGDIMAVLPNGQHCEIECKRGKGGKLSKEQQKRMQRLQRVCGLYYVVHGVEELEHYLFPILSEIPGQRVFVFDKL